MHPNLTLILERTRSGISSDTALNPGGAESSSEFNKLSGELNQRITQEMNDLMRSVSSQIQRAISEAINGQVLPQIQATLTSGQGQVPSRGGEVPTEGRNVDLKKP